MFLWLQPSKKTSFIAHDHQKLSCKSYGPYHIIQRIGLVVYKLTLLDSSKIHPILHVSCLKKWQVLIVIFSLHFQSWIRKDPFGFNPHPSHKLGSGSQWTIKEVLVQWRDTSSEDATWERPLFCSNFHIFNLDNKAIFQGGGHLRNPS